jgi:hypothetical protein
MRIISKYHRPLNPHNLPIKAASFRVGFLCLYVVHGHIPGVPFQFLNDRFHLVLINCDKHG